MSSPKEEVIQAINTIEENDSLEKIHMFLIGMLAQQTIQKQTA